MLLIAKIHELFSRQNPVVAPIRTTGWLSVVALTGTFMLIMPLTRAIEFYCLEGDLKIGQVPMTALTLLLAYLYFKYIDRQLFGKNKIGLIVNKYRNRNIPAVLLYLMIMFLPMALLFTGAVITTWLFGGKLLGENITGILE